MVWFHHIFYTHACTHTKPSMCCTSVKTLTKDLLHHARLLPLVAQQVERNTREDDGRADQALEGGGPERHHYHEGAAQHKGYWDHQWDLSQNTIKQSIIRDTTQHCQWGCYIRCANEDFHSRCTYCLQQLASTGISGTGYTRHKRTAHI